VARALAAKIGRAVSGKAKVEYERPWRRPSRRISAVTRRKSTELESLTRRISSRDDRDIDQLYGLEPIFEPGSSARGGELEQFVPVQCPYCGERLETRVDLTAGDREYIEDCEVCCRPIEFGIELAEDGALNAVRVQRLD
jgi:hypothetical protein